jgi:excisionase family DNA binding protein
MSGDAERELELTLTIPEGLLAALAERIAAKLPHQPPPAQTASPWLDTAGACAYLGLSRQQLYKLTAARSIPVRKKRGGHGLRFHRGELDAWLEQAYESTGWTPQVELWSTTESDSDT